MLDINKKTIRLRLEISSTLILILFLTISNSFYTIFSHFSATHAPLCLGPKTNNAYVYRTLWTLVFYVLTAIFVFEGGTEKTKREMRKNITRTRRVSHVKRKSRVWFNLRAKTNYRLATYATYHKLYIQTGCVTLGASTLTQDQRQRERGEARWKEMIGGSAFNTFLS